MRLDTPGVERVDTSGVMMVDTPCIQKVYTSDVMRVDIQWYPDG